MAIAAVVALALAGCAGEASGVDSDEYVAANQAILDELPRFPGSTEREEESTPYRGEENQPVVGYGTRIVLTLPPGTQVGDAVTYFQEHLEPGWELVERLDGPVLNYRRGDASASINLENWRVERMEIGVDHMYYSNRGL